VPDLDPDSPLLCEFIAAIMPTDAKCQPIDVPSGLWKEAAGGQQQQSDATAAAAAGRGAYCALALVFHLQRQGII
jgi:hypothetical protein